MNKKFNIKPPTWPKEYTFQEFVKLNPHIINENQLITLYNQYLNKYLEETNQKKIHFKQSKINQLLTEFKKSKINEIININTGGRSGGDQFSNNYSLAFTGTSADLGNSEYVSTTFNPDTYELWNGFTVSYWVKPDQLGNHMFAIGKKGITPTERFTFGVNTGVNAYAGIGGNKIIGIAHGMSTGTWYHWAFTYAGNSNGKVVKMYRDGVKLDTGSPNYADGTATWSDTGGFSGGIYLNGRNLESTGYNNGWDCNLDEVAIFDEVVDISTLYDGTDKPTDLTNVSGLIGYWRFTEGTGTTVTDLSGQGNHGTLTTADSGLPTWSTDVP